MQVHRVMVPGSRVESWTVLGDDGVPVAAVESWLAYLSNVGRSPNTVKAYAHDLKDFLVFIAGRAWTGGRSSLMTWASMWPGWRCRRAAVTDFFRRHARSVNVPPRLPSLGRMTALASRAGHLAQALLQEPLPRRWTHVQGVAARARSLASVLGADADLLEAAAWLHDIGYAPGLAVTGLHALDGARYLRDAQHADAMLCRLVAHHSCAIIEAGERGLADVLSLEFDPAPYALASVLTCCDMTTSPDGELVPVEQRLA